MPALTTHNFHAKDVFKKLDFNIQKSIENDLNFYHVFAQSFDLFFYYRLPLGIGKKIRDFGYRCQHINTQSYFLNMIRLIKTKNLTHDSEALAYLYGSITHYVLDSIVHPFVFYKTGCFDKKKKETFKYNNMHAKMEYSIDAYIYEKRFNSPFYKYKFVNDLMPRIKSDKKLINLINETYKKTFYKENIAHYYFKGYKWSKFLYRLLVYDPIGWKKIIYRLIDKITPASFKKVHYYSFHIKNINHNFLNPERKTWPHPCDTQIKYNYSFDELYEIAVSKATAIINKVYLVLENKADIKSLIKVIPNIDYATGFLLNKNKKMQFFEY